MYIPASYAETDLARLHALMQRHNFATLISSGSTAPSATPLPFLIDPDAGAYGTLISHLARANPHWKQLTPDADVLVIFQGAHSYISPRWYAQPSVVPTWNYAAVHAYGKPRLIHDPVILKQMVTALVAYHEGPEGLPGFEADFPEHLLQAIVGLEIPIDRLEGKFKMSQNKSLADQEVVIARLAASTDSMQREVAQIMQEHVGARTL